MWNVLHKSTTVNSDTLPAAYGVEFGKKIISNSFISVSTYFNTIANEFLLSEIHKFLPSIKTGSKETNVLKQPIEYHKQRAAFNQTS